MITQNRYDLSGDITYQGRSTDSKPTEDVYPNSLFHELDTGDTYFYDPDGSWTKCGGFQFEFDGTKDSYDQEMKKWFDLRGVNAKSDIGITEMVDQWYKATRDYWCGGVRFNQPAQSSVSTGMKTGDNAGLNCVPSTNSEKNTDDYEGLPLFTVVDCNFRYDPESKRPIITAIDGITSGFERDNPEKLVGVLQQSGFYYRNEKDNEYEIGVSSHMQNGYDLCVPYPEAVEQDGSVREWVLHSKYMSKVVDNKLTSYSGAIPTAWMSQNVLVDRKNSMNNGLCGGCLCDLTFLKMMFMVKYASLSADGILQGCLNYNYQYCVAKGETGVKRVLLTSAQAANIIEGSSILIGTYNGTTKDRNTAANYDISGQAGCKVISKETVTIGGVSYVALNLDRGSDEDIDTVGDGTETAGNTIISTFHWPNGTCDNVLGNDGSPATPDNGKYPAKLQGIEYSVGGNEVLADVILSQDADNYYLNVVNDLSKHSKNAVANYSLEGTCPKIAAADGWQYIKKESLSDKGFLFPCLVGGSSSTYHKDGFYQNGQNTTSGLREYLAFGFLNCGTADGGLSCLYGNFALSTALWYFVARLSCNGNRGEWTA